MNTTLIPFAILALTFCACSTEQHAPAPVDTGDPDAAQAVLDVSTEDVPDASDNLHEVSSTRRTPRSDGSTPITTRNMLEQFEVIQEKRMVRIRKPKSRTPHDRTIEIIATHGGRTATHSDRTATAESYQNPGTHSWVATSADPLSTFAADVDTGSYTIARRKLNEGTLPPADSVRPEEWINYFDYDYPQPASGTFGVSLEAAPSPFQTSGDFRLLRVGVQAQRLPKDRHPIHLVFLVDVSGSMISYDKLELAKRSLEVLVGHLQPEDTVALTTYAGTTETVLGPTKVSKRKQILTAIRALGTGGGTAMDDGLKAAYALADETFVANHENRVIVLSDGDANVGGTSVDEMLATIADGAKRGITLSTIGFGMGNYKDAQMEQLANKGNGNYYYVDGIHEAERIFGQDLESTLFTMARDVKLQVEFNPDAVKRYRLIGYENRDIADKDFRNDKVDAGEVGAGHSVTALYELEMVGAQDATVATVRIRHKSPNTDGGRASMHEMSTQLLRSEIAPTLADTTASFQFAAAVAAFAEVLGKSPHAAHLNLDWVHEIAEAATAKQADRTELVALIRKARAMTH